jgi:hypothetical protein
MLNLRSCAKRLGIRKVARNAAAKIIDTFFIFPPPESAK